MTTHRKTGGDKDDPVLDEALAVLISSTRNKNRPLPLTEIAKWLDIAVSRLGGYGAVADRIGLSSKMLRQFSSVTRLSPPVRALFRNRRLDSVDSAVHLAMIAPREQHALARALASGEIDTSDIRAVIQLRRSGSNLDVKKALRRVKASKSKREYVAEFAVRGGLTKPAIVKLFHTYIPKSEIRRIELRGALGRVVFTGKGKKLLSGLAKKFDVPVKRVISTILHKS